MQQEQNTSEPYDTLTSEGSGELPMQIRALLMPSGVGAGKPGMDASARLQLQSLLPQLEQKLSDSLSAPVAIEMRPQLEDSSFVPCRDEVFALRMQCTTEEGQRETAYLALDLRAARAIVDALEARLAGLRGVGDLTDAELGLLEFLGLELLDSLSGMLPELGKQWQVDAFFSGKEIQHELSTSGLDGRVSFRVGVAAQAGVAMFWSEPKAGLQALTVRAPQETRTGQLWISIALPTIELESERAASLRPGDVVLLGTSDLLSFGAGYRVLSSTGWQLSEATLQSDSPTLASASAGEFLPEVASHAISRPGMTALVATLGWLEVSTTQLSRWRAGDALDFQKGAGGSVELHTPDTSMRGELVRIDQEVGLRVLA